MRADAVRGYAFAAVAGAVVLVTASMTIAAAHAQKFVLHGMPQPVPTTIQFEDREGKSRSLLDFRGTIVLLNIWATWCVPCRKEMPALDRLQAAMAGADFQIVTLAIDRGGIDVVRKFFANIGIQNLAPYLDTSGKAARDLGVVGLPVTLLLDQQAHETGRLIGPADWDGPEMMEFVRCVISQSRKDPKPVEKLSCGESSP